MVVELLPTMELYVPRVSKTEHIVLDVQAPQQKPRLIHLRQVEYCIKRRDAEKRSTDCKKSAGWQLKK